MSVRKSFAGLLLLYFLPITNLFGQSIPQMEYFFNADPGIGNGNPLTITPADSVSINQAINVTGLSAGVHKVGIRARNNNGVWGHAEFRNLFILSVGYNATDSMPGTAEYFYNTDPGVGNATRVMFSPANSVNVNIPLDITALGIGSHSVGVRFRNQHGEWGHTEFRKLFIQNSIADTLNREIIGGEYYFGDTIPPSGGGYSFSVANAGDSITVLIADTLNNLTPGQHKIHIRFKNARDEWSHQESRMLTICSIYGPQSDFTYRIEGNKAFFTNESVFDDTRTWKFGDNLSDTVRHPIKTYLSAGPKMVELITQNVCGNDTLATPLEIRGLQNINPGRAGNAGISTLTFEGFGFTSSTEVKLVSGTQAYVPLSKTFLSSNRIRAYFDLSGMTPGQYKAVAVLSGPFDTLQNGLTIVNSLDITFSLSQTSRTFIRPIGAILVSNVQNLGSHDAIMVPYIAALNFKPGIAANQNFFSLMDMVFLPTQGIFQHTFQYINDHQVPTTVMEENMLDSARGRHLIAYYKVKIPGQATTTEIARNSNPSTFAYQVGSFVQTELLDSYSMIGTINTEYKACYSSFLKYEVEKQLNINIFQAGWDNCFNNAFDTLMRTLSAISQNPLLEDFAVPMQAGFSALLAKMAECPGSGIPPGLGGITFKRVIQGVMNNWIFQEDIDSLHPDCIDTTVLFNNARLTTQNLTGGRISGTEAFDCSDCPGAAIFPEMCETCGPILKMKKGMKKNKVLKRQLGLNSAVVGCQEWCENTSADPNVKYGPGNNDDRKYINHIGEVGYTISFENLPTATAPAAFVEIRDTIDKSVFDINSLQFRLLSWGDSIITLEPNKTDHSILKDLRPVHPNFLRIDMVTDTSSGELRCRFWTLDTISLQLTDDPTQGFLPPNTDGVSGQGQVTFTIRPNETVTNGTALLNEATIIFDENDPISTGVWEYRIDTLPPVSQVNSLPIITNTTSFNVSWTGSDAHSGIDLYSVYVSVNDSAYQLWKSLTSATTDVFNGQFGNTYKFISIALDKATNFEEPPVDALNNPDAFTSVENPLPLDLLNFSAAKSSDGKKVNLVWITTNEHNVSHFELQRSADGVNYSGITRIAAQNNPTGASYNWQDIHPLPKINYYRLKIADIDSTFKLSPVRMVRFADDKDILIFPTLTSNFVFVQSGKEVIAELYNTSGVKLETKVVRETTRFDLSRYATGIYYIRIASENRSIKIIKK